MTKCYMVGKVNKNHKQVAYWGQNPMHYSEVDWPTYGIDKTFIPNRCDACGIRYHGAELSHMARTSPQYDTPSGHLEPGCMFYTKCSDCPWDNCDGRHLMATCPNGDVWDIDGRASNCTMPEERTHRCWVRHGEPPDITVDKNGHTCSAGAGSIATGDYHGFLQNGSFT